MLAAQQRVEKWLSCGTRRQQLRSPYRISGKANLVQKFTISLLFCFLLLCRASHAHQLLGQDEILPKELLYDRRAPPPPPRMHLEVRDEASVLASTTIRPSGSATATGDIQVATETATTLPRPFDSNLGNNFTTSTCPTFFERFLNDQAFASCLPLSLLLQVCQTVFLRRRASLTICTRHPVASSQLHDLSYDSRPFLTAHVTSTFQHARP
jgi:hypothetical protein